MEWNGMEWNDNAHITAVCAFETAVHTRKIPTKALQMGRQSEHSSFVHKSRLCGLMVDLCCDQRSMDWKFLALAAGRAEHERRLDRRKLYI